MRPTDIIAKKIAPVLIDDGFRGSASTGIFTIPTAEGFVGWLGVGMNSDKRIVEVNLTAGVRSEAIESLLDELLGDRASRYKAPTISLHIGYLMPENTYRPWHVSEEASDAPIREMASAIRRFAVPFMHANSTLRSLAQGLCDFKLAHHERAMYRLPLCLLLQGDLRTAKSLTAEYERSLASRNDAAADMYRAFAEALKPMVQIQ